MKPILAAYVGSLAVVILGLPLLMKFMIWYCNFLGL